MPRDAPARLLEDGFGGNGTRPAGRLLAEASARLRRAGSTSPRLDALLLLAHATGWARTRILAHPEWRIAAEQVDRFLALVERRVAREPVAYLVGERAFYGRTFRADRRALIPRPETELLVEEAIRAVAACRERGLEEPLVVDVGTGSGAIAVSVAAETGACVVAADRSWAALELAHENVLLLGQAGRVRLLQADLLAGLRGPIHVLLANLPYIPRGRTLPVDVVGYEPREALFAGPRGTELNEALLEQARRLLAPGAVAVLELDEQGQAGPLRAAARRLFGPDASVEVLRDAAGAERALRLRLRG